MMMMMMINDADDDACPGEEKEKKDKKDKFNSATHRAKVGKAQVKRRKLEFESQQENIGNLVHRSLLVLLTSRVGFRFLCMYVYISCMHACMFFL